MKHLLLTTIAAVVLVGCGERLEISQKDKRNLLIAFEDAVQRGDIKTVEKALIVGADPNKLVNDNNPVLLVAAQEGWTKILRLLINKGADVNVSNNNGWTPLHASARFANAEVVKLLIDSGAQLNSKIHSATSTFEKQFIGHTPLDSLNIGPSPPTRAKKETADLLRKHGGKTGAELKAEGK